MRRRRRVPLLLALALVVSLSACPEREPAGEAGVDVPVPADWTDHGAILQAGAEGAWDHRNTGALSPSALIEVPAGFGAFTEDTRLLYYMARPATVPTAARRTASSASRPAPTAATGRSTRAIRS